MSIQTTVAEAASTDSPVVAAKLNEQQLLGTLGHLFSTSLSVIGELLQNGRRAGATEIRIDYLPETESIVVTDNGRGVDDFQKLLTLAESGWNEVLKKAETPYGMGFYSCFFAADSVLVESRGLALDASLADVTAQRQLKLLPAPDGPAVGTRVTLRGVVQALRPAHGLDWLADRLARLCRGFPIPVIVDGVEMQRVDAAANLDGVHTPIGFIHFGEFDKIAPASLGRPSLYLQGLPIGSGNTDRTVVLHLNEAEFTPTMPDRAHLFDEELQLKRIRTGIMTAARAWLATVKQELGRAEFVRRMWTPALAIAPGLLDDIPYIPAHCFWAVICVAPEIEEVFTAAYGSKAPLVDRESIETGKVRVWRGAGSTSDGYAFTPMLLRLMREHKIRSTPLRYFGPGHWIHQCTPAFDDLVVETAVHGAGNREGSYSSGHFMCAIRSADSVDYRVVSRKLPSTSPAIVEGTWTDGYALVPARACLERVEECDTDADFDCYVLPGISAEGDVPAMLDTFRDDSEVYRQEWAEMASRVWAEQVDYVLTVPFSATVERTVAADRLSAMAEHAGQFAVTGVVEREPGTVRVMTANGHAIEVWQRFAAAAGLKGKPEDLRAAFFGALFPPPDAIVPVLPAAN